MEASPPAVRFDSPSDRADSKMQRLAQDVRRELLSCPGLEFSSLVVRRIQNGVCLQGVLEANPSKHDVSRLARSVAGVECVLNHLVVRQPESM